MLASMEIHHRQVFPILLDEMVRDGKIQKGNKIIMAGFGAGLTWSAVYLEF